MDENVQVMFDIINLEDEIRDIEILINEHKMKKKLKDPIQNIKEPKQKSLSAVPKESEPVVDEDPVDEEPKRPRNRSRGPPEKRRPPGENRRLSSDQRAGRRPPPDRRRLSTSEQNKQGSQRSVNGRRASREIPKNQSGGNRPTPGGVFGKELGNRRKTSEQQRASKRNTERTPRPSADSDRTAPNRRNSSRGPPDGQRRPSRGPVPRGKSPVEGNPTTDRRRRRTATHN
eukprot:TRINITY_DN1864_c0_g1_i1.p1 TRINITY_DN1864_c0_g1~~TRINITY_DN1864_c0_g1_i1.p1  ORF type:complete len:255 (+),score=73.29 TRINITY_DN1864_c0_g1_i1:76-765(+)